MIRRGPATRRRSQRSSVVPRSRWLWRLPWRTQQAAARLSDGLMRVQWERTLACILSNRDLYAVDRLNGKLSTGGVDEHGLAGADVERERSVRVAGNAVCE